MGRLLVRRAFVLRLILVLVPLVIALLTILGYSTSRYKKDYYDKAASNCDILAAELSAQSGRISGEQTVEQVLPYVMNQIADEQNVLIYLFDTQGVCVLLTDNTGQQPKDLSLDGDILSEMEQNGRYLDDQVAGKFNPDMTESMVCCGVSLKLTINSNIRTYYLLSCTTTRPVNVYSEDMVFMAVVLLIGITVLSAVFILYSMGVRQRRQEQFLRVLRRYAQDDFSRPLDPQQYNDTELEELAHLTLEISSHAQRAEEASREFVSNVSHELRTPMTVIKGFVEGILDGTIPKNRRMEYLSLVSQEIQRLQMLVTSMLNLTKFDTGSVPLNYRVFTLNDTAFRMALMFGSRLEQRHITVEGLDSEPVRVYADPDLMGQVIYNLMENAVKFVNDGGTITFTFREEKDEWIFAIRNTGNGISKEELPKIFGRFYKSDASRSKDKTGLGLGLDIVRRIVHLHHAQISARSEENVYTEFEVRLPRVEQALRE